MTYCSKTNAAPSLGYDYMNLWEIMRSNSHNTQKERSNTSNVYIYGYCVFCEVCVLITPSVSIDMCCFFTGEDRWIIYLYIFVLHWLVKYIYIIMLSPSRVPANWPLITLGLSYVNKTDVIYWGRSQQTLPLFGTG